jgi:hypothetical protein
MKIFFFILTLFCNGIYAEQIYSIEESLTPQAKIPESVLSDLKNEVDLEIGGCTQSSLAEALEATHIELDSKYPTLLIKPKTNAWCLCGAYVCPVWIYQLTSKGSQRIWSTSGTDIITIQDRNSHGYRNILSESGTAGHGDDEQWVWSGKKYKLARKKSWLVGQ